MSRRLRILISAGEASGDRLGAGLALALRRRRPEVELLGMGGDAMAEAGVRLLQHASEVAVVGITEVLAHLPAIRRAMSRLERALEDERPDLLVPVDFPDFNLRLAARARRSRVPVVYFVSPQVWAWRRGRVRTLRRLVRRMLVLFPFENRFYEEEGVPVSFVGHPAAEAPASVPARGDLLARAGLDPARRTVALLPGSRRGEVARLLPAMVGAACRLRAARPDLQFLIPRARTLPEGLLEGEVTRFGLADARVHGGDYPDVLAACDAAVVASGTATLETALAGVPMVVVYRMQLLSYLLGRLLVRVDHVALANLVAGRRAAPELIQADCTPQRIEREVGRLLDDPTAAARAREAQAEIRTKLGGPGPMTVRRKRSCPSSMPGS
jgi:lipid-A-disaccharide synthase